MPRTVILSVSEESPYPSSRSAYFAHVLRNLTVYFFTITGGRFIFHLHLLCKRRQKKRRPFAAVMTLSLLFCHSERKRRISSSNHCFPVGGRPMFLMCLPSINILRNVHMQIKEKKSFVARKMLLRVKRWDVIPKINYYGIHSACHPRNLYQRSSPYF